MKTFNLNTDEFNVIELSTEQLTEVHGGDAFLKDLGYAIGYVAGFIKDAFTAPKFDDVNWSSAAKTH